MLLIIRVFIARVINIAEVILIIRIGIHVYIDFDIGIDIRSKVEITIRHRRSSWRQQGVDVFLKYGDVLIILEATILISQTTCFPYLYEPLSGRHPPPETMAPSVSSYT